MWRKATPQIFGKAPLWSFYPIGLVLLFAGLVVISAIVGFPEGVNPKGATLRMAPLWVLVLVPVGEAFLWTVAFVEGFARVFRAPLLGALCGVFAYSVLYHARGGALAIAASGWLGAVVGYLYVVMRERSRWAAILNAVCIRWTFVAYAFIAVGGLD
jgi:hypothetical protein